MRPFPLTASAAKWQITFDGGKFPTWSRTAHDLIYMTRFRLMVVNYRVEGNNFIADKPRPWPGEQSFFMMGDLPDYALTPDGRHAIGMYDFSFRSFRQPYSQVNFLLNFTDELKRRAP